jgi:PPIC-type PPIASE domain
VRSTPVASPLASPLAGPPARPLARFLVSLSMVPLVLGGLSACGSTSSNESVVAGSFGATSADQLEAELKTLVAIPSFVTGWEQAIGSPPKKGAGFTAELVAFVLQQRMFNAAIDAETKGRKLVPLPVTEEMTSQLEQATPGGKETLDAYPPAYREEQLRNQQNIAALLKSVAGDPKKYFEANPEAFAETCLSHILVDKEPEATAAVKRLAAGEAFEKVATELSKDPGSGAQGGSLGCVNDLAQFVPEFAAAAKTAEINKVTAPVKTQFGYHLLKVTKRGKASFDDEATKAKATEAAQQAGIEGLRVTLRKRIVDAKLVVNPKFAKLEMGDETAFPQIVSRAEPAVPSLPEGPQPEGPQPEVPQQ